MDDNNRMSFSGRLGYVLAAAGSAVGLGNIWRFPYLAAKYGGGIFLLCYMILVALVGCVFVISETALGRMTRKSPIGAFATFGEGPFFGIGGCLNAIVPMIIVPYYSVIGGWVLKYLAEYAVGNGAALASGEYFGTFIGNSGSVEMWFVIYAAINIIVIWFGVENGIERVSKFLMPVLVALALFIAIYSSTRPGAAAGIRYFLVPDFSNFSIMTLVAAFGQMFYSMSIAMGILFTYGSYMKKDVNIETSSYQIAAFDTGVAILGGFMIIPAVFAFSGGDVNALLQKGPSLTFVTLPKVFLNMKGGQLVAVCFFFMFFLAALTSSISLFETCISTVGDEMRLSRRKSIAAVCLITLALGTMSAFGYGIWDKVRIAGMQFLDFFDFISNSIMLPIASLFTVVLILAHVGVDRIKGEVLSSSPFKSKRLYDLVIRFVAPPVIAIVLVSSILDAFGVLKI